MGDLYANVLNGLGSPAINSAPVTPSDSVDLPTISRGLFVGTAGDLSVALAGDAGPTLLKNINAGQVLPIRARRIYMTSTTAADIVALW